MQPDISELDYMTRERLILLSHLSALKMATRRTPDLESARLERIGRVTAAVFELDRRISEIEVGTVVQVPTKKAVLKK